MTDNDAMPPRRRFSWGALAVLLLLVLLGAGGYGGWRVWHANHDTEDTVAAQENLLVHLSHQLSDTQSQLEELRTHLGDLTDSQRQSADAIARLQGRGDEVDQAIARLSADLKGGRIRAQLVTVEQLLLLANDRAQLAHDARGAALALQLAEDRLGSLAEPRLFEVRKAIADERAALQALPQADRAGAALSLSGLIDRADTLPLRQHPAVQAAAAAPQATPAMPPFGRSWTSRGWDSVREMLGHVFIVHRTDKPVDRLLPPEQEVLVKQLLALKLESARAALLLGDTASFRSALDSAGRWLGDYYRPEDPAVSAARAELERLRTLELDPPLPDLSRSVGLLRAYIDAMPR